MSEPRLPEHYATLFDHHFLAQGLCLYRSLVEHAGYFHLWILCMDEAVEQALRRLDLPDVTLLPLREQETSALLSVKSGRTAGEYCWTLTPFVASFVFEKAPEAPRVTYLDADLYLFDRPDTIFREFEQSSRHVLITEHAYAPEYAFQLPVVGRFCVQFMTFRNTSPAREVLAWWQDRCIEWCFARAEEGRFGDQKYLDDWPTRFPSSVHVLTQVEKTLAPWNALHFERRGSGQLRPVLYHFQGLRLHEGRQVTLYSGYRIGPGALRLYRRYLDELQRVSRDLEARGIAVASLPRARGIRAGLIRLRRMISGTERRATLQ